jgi:hypothetical protein
LTVVAAIAFVAAWVVGFALQGRSVLAQRLEPHSSELSAALGELGTPIGSPQRLVIFDERAFLGNPQPDGSRLVSERYLVENNIYPLQWKTVEFVRNAVALSSGLGLLVCGLTWWQLARRRGSSRDPRGTPV